MSTPVIWIFLPFVMGIILFLLRRWYRSTVWIGTITAVLLAGSAWVLPINQLIRLGPVVLEIEENFEFLGRSFSLTKADRTLVVFIFGLAAFWFSAAYEARAGRMFVPIGLVMVSLWIAALAVEPFLYAALILELSVLLSIPMLSPPGLPPTPGAIRYLILQTLGMPFLLLTGWLLAGVESTPGDSALVGQVSVLLGLGFVFLLGIFPFHTWQPMLSETSLPYAVAFIFFFLPFMVILFGLSFLDQYAWLRQSAATYEMLRIAGVIMIVVGGAWAALQRHLGRILGYAVLASTGMLLLSIGSYPGLDLFFAMQFPRALAFALWGLGLSVIRRQIITPSLPASEIEPLNPPPSTPSYTSETFRYRNVYGLGRRLPVATAAITLSVFSIAGYPILASFPVYQALYQNLTAQNPMFSIVAVAGIFCLCAGGLRSFSVLIMGDNEDPWKFSEHWVTTGFLGVGMLLMILIGLFPHWFVPFTTQLTQIYSQLAAQSILP
jgi:formate hydrogenlyase subunit 3/multisubunit Na+/H+ antiporter MnhD subunit